MTNRYLILARQYLDESETLGQEPLQLRMAIRAVVKFLESQAESKETQQSERSSARTQDGTAPPPFEWLAVSQDLIQELSALTDRILGFSKSMSYTEQGWAVIRQCSSMLQQMYESHTPSTQSKAGDRGAADPDPLHDFDPIQFATDVQGYNEALSPDPSSSSRESK